MLIDPSRTLHWSPAGGQPSPLEMIEKEITTTVFDMRQLEHRPSSPQPPRNTAIRAWMVGSRAADTARWAQMVGVNDLRGRVLEGAAGWRVAVERFLRDELERAAPRRVKHRLRDIRMEVGAGALADLVQGHIQRHPSPIGPVGGQPVDGSGCA